MEVIGLEIGGIPATLESDVQPRHGLSARLGLFRSEETMPSAFIVTATVASDVTDQDKKKPYRGFVFRGNERVVFDQLGLKGQIDLAGRSACVQFACRDCDDELDYFLRVLYSLLAFESGGLLVHGAGIVRSGTAYIFLGPSGTGKTTIATLSPNHLVLNDDLMLLRPGPDNWTAWSTPFSGRGQVEPKPGSAPLRGLLRLAQAENHWLERVSSTSALALLVAACPVVTADPNRGKALMPRLKSLLNRYPLYMLHFRKDPGFWEVLGRDFGD